MVDIKQRECAVVDEITQDSSAMQANLFRSIQTTGDRCGQQELVCQAADLARLERLAPNHGILKPLSQNYKTIWCQQYHVNP
jgi:hypothetical protein